jgi:hypothetical protein
MDGEDGMDGRGGRGPHRMEEPRRTRRREGWRRMRRREGRRGTLHGAGRRLDRDRPRRLRRQARLRAERKPVAAAEERLAGEDRHPHGQRDERQRRQLPPQLGHIPVTIAGE